MKKPSLHELAVALSHIVEFSDTHTKEGSAYTVEGPKTRAALKKISATLPIVRQIIEELDRDVSHELGGPEIQREAWRNSSTHSLLVALTTLNADLKIIAEEEKITDKGKLPSIIKQNESLISREAIGHERMEEPEGKSPFEGLKFQPKRLSASMHGRLHEGMKSALSFTDAHAILTELGGRLDASTARELNIHQPTGRGRYE